MMVFRSQEQQASQSEGVKHDWGELGVNWGHIHG
jgi:hypothetical protein